MISLNCMHCGAEMSVFDIKSSPRYYLFCKDIINNKRICQEFYFYNNNDICSSYYIDFFHKESDRILVLHGSLATPFTEIYDKKYSEMLIHINQFKELDLLNIKDSFNNIKDFLSRMIIFK